jgi:hypothetical protein
MNQLDQYYLDLPEPNKSCLLALRDLIMTQNKSLMSAWKWKTPFFYYKGQMLFYLWIDKKLKVPYIGITNGYQLEHPALTQGKRTRIKLLFVDPEQDLPVELITDLLQQSIKLCEASLKGK